MRQDEEEEYLGLVKPNIWEAPIFEGQGDWVAHPAMGVKAAELWASSYGFYGKRPLKLENNIYLPGNRHVA